MCSSGKSTSFSRTSATWCIVFVQRTKKSAPDASSERAAATSAVAASSQRPSTCMRSIPAKSTEYVTQRAEEPDQLHLSPVVGPLPASHPDLDSRPDGTRRQEERRSASSARNGRSG